jgi:hypothetical protein
MIERYAYLWLRSRELARFTAGAARARDVQHQTLLAKVRRNAESEFGRDHGFAEIRSLDDFRRRLPISTYEDYRPYVDRLQQGRITAMFGEGTRVLMLAMTSGTTNKSKYVPVTQEFFDEYRRGWNLWGIGLYRDHHDLLHKKNLKFGSNWRQSVTEGGIPCGNISGLVAETAPWIIKRRFVVPSAATGIDNPASKHYTALRLAFASRRVGWIGTANPSTLIEVAKLGDARRESLIRDIFEGTLAADVVLPDDVRQDLAPRLARRDPRRAQELEAIVERTGALYPKDVWPTLSTLTVWMGGSVGVYLPRLEEYYGRTALRDHGLSASEGRMTIPLCDGTSAGVLEYCNHFFEFIPEDEHGRPDATVLEAHELEEGKDYYILLTTSAGMYRYDIHDVVRCVGYLGEAPLLTFLNKGAHFSSITGEKLSEFQVVSAVRDSFRELRLVIDHFTVAPVMGERPGYLLLLEPHTAGGRDEELAAEVDRRLGELNCEYAEKRRTGRLEPLAVRQIPPGAWDVYRRQKTAQRGNLEEFKQPCLVGDLQFVERLLSHHREAMHAK